jgi:hypothetical protein
MVMSSGRALHAGAGEFHRGRKLRGDDCGRRRSSANPNEPERLEPAESEAQRTPEQTRVSGEPNEPEELGAAAAPAQIGRSLERHAEPIGHLLRRQKLQVRRTLHVLRDRLGHVSRVRLRPQP